MKKTVQRISKCKVFWGMLALVFVLGAGLFSENLAIVSHAESAAKVTASSAKIRKTADSSSEVIGSAAKDKAISIKSQTKGADGYTWYEVYVDANTLGYIRSDLVSITDGSTPPSSSGTTTTTTTTTTATPAPVVNETPVEVTAVEPLSATVTGGQSVRVRSNASTTSQIVTTAENGMALTVTGQATGTDGKTWYQISFISNSVEVTGFIRSDYVALSGELQAPVEEQPVEEQPTDEQPAEDTQTTSKDWDTQMQGDAWYLLDMAGQKQYKIEDLFNSLNQITEINAQYETNQKKISSQKAVIIILVILLVAAVAAVTLLIFKIKDMNDASYFSGVEEETVRRRRVDRRGEKILYQYRWKIRCAGSDTAQKSGSIRHSDDLSITWSDFERQPWFLYRKISYMEQLRARRGRRFSCLRIHSWKYKAAAEKMVEVLRANGASKVVFMDLTRDDMAEAVADAFRYGKIILAAASYDAWVFPPMEDFLHRLAHKNLQKRTFGLIENGSWAPCAAKGMKGILEGMKEVNVCENVVSIKSTMKDTDVAKMEELAKEILA